MQKRLSLSERLEELEPLMQSAFEKNLWLFHGLSSSWFTVIQLREMIRLKQYENVYPASEFVLLDPYQFKCYLEKEAAKSCQHWFQLRCQIARLSQRLALEPGMLEENKARVQ